MEKQLLVGTMRWGFRSIAITREPFTSDADCLADCHKLANCWDKKIKLTPQFIKSMEPTALEKANLFKGKYILPDTCYVSLLEGDSLNAFSAQVKANDEAGHFSQLT